MIRCPFVLFALLACAAHAEPKPATVREIVDALASDSMEGRAFGSPGATRARDWLVEWLSAHGVTPLGSKDGSFEQRFEGGGVNLLGVVAPPGTDPKRPKVLIGAHYDHLSDGACEPSALAASAVCNGAADNAAGVAAALAAVEALAGRTRQPVAVALWDGEEQFMLGSQHFFASPTFPLASLALYVNLDIVGLDLFKGLERLHFAIGAETGGRALQDDVAAARVELDVVPLSYGMAHGRSDMTSLLLHDLSVPFVFLTDGDGGVYHSSADEPQRLNFAKATQVARFVEGIVRKVDARDSAYVFARPEKTPLVPKEHMLAYLPVFEDVARVHELLLRVLAVGKDNGLDTTTLADLEAQTRRLEEIAKAGRQEFGLLDVVAVGVAARKGLGASRARVLPRLPGG